jgi:hypothetical protein
VKPNVDRTCWVSHSLNPTYGIAGFSKLLSVNQPLSRADIPEPLLHQAQADYKSLNNLDRLFRKYLEILRAIASQNPFISFQEILFARAFPPSNHLKTLHKFIK